MQIIKAVHCSFNFLLPLSLIAVLIQLTNDHLIMFDVEIA